VKRMSAKSIALVSHDAVLTTAIKETLKHDYSLVAFDAMKDAMDHIYSAMPHLVIFDMDLSDPLPLTMLTNLKSDPLFSGLPVLAALKEGSPLPVWGAVFVEDYFWKSDRPSEIKSRVELSMLRSERMVEVNPLTRLPGNIMINRSIQALLEGTKVFAIAYADLDNFKPYNDHYGFSRGDEVLKMTARLILNIVKSRQPGGSFVGHIGGDDFVFVMDPDIIEDVAAEIVDAFDRIISTFYDEEDWAKGFIESEDRQGIRRSFPHVSISIGITNNRQRKFTHFGQITETVSEMKQYCKAVSGSCFRSDKRQD
jgi:diguanylate cyclase (GGDEF)-like protein